MITLKEFKDNIFISTYSLNNNLLYLPKAFFFNSNKINTLSLKEKISQFEKTNIEFCSGNGEWIYNKSIKDKNTLWISVEISFKRSFQIYKKIISNDLKNIILIIAEASLFGNYYLENNSIDKAYINFPDPWSKNKHKKNRLIHLSFFNTVKRILKDNGSFELVTDHILNFQTAIEISKINEFKYLDLSSNFHKEDYGSSFFLNLFLSQNKTIYHLLFY